MDKGEADLHTEGEKIIAERLPLSGDESLDQRCEITVSTNRAENEASLSDEDEEMVKNLIQETTAVDSVQQLESACVASDHDSTKEEFMVDVNLDNVDTDDQTQDKNYEELANDPSSIPDVFPTDDSENVTESKIESCSADNNNRLIEEDDGTPRVVDSSQEASPEVDQPNSNDFDEMTTTKSNHAPIGNSSSPNSSPSKTSPETEVWRKVFLHMEKSRVKPIKLFREIDVDESGSISAKELRDGLKKIVDVDLSDEEFKLVLKVVDKDRSNDINYRELSRAIKYGNPQRKISMKATSDKHAAMAARKKKRSPVSPTPSNMSTSSSLTSFKVPTGIPSIDREGYKQEKFMKAMLVPSRVRRKSNRAREELLRDFSISSDLSVTMASTIELAGPALRESGFSRSPTNRDNPNPDLGGTDAPVDAEYVRAQRSRRRAERAKAAEENWSEWKQEKTREIAERRRRKKEREEAKAAKLAAKKEAGKAAYRAWKAKEKQRRKEKRKAMREAEAKAAEKQREAEKLAEKLKEKKRIEREKQQFLLNKMHERQAISDATVSQEVDAIEALARRRNKELKKKLKKLLSTPYTDPTTLSLIRGRTPGGSKKKDKVAPAWLLHPKVAKQVGLRSEGTTSVKDVSPPSKVTSTEAGRGGSKRPLPQIPSNKEAPTSGVAAIANEDSKSLTDRPPWNGNEYRAKSRQGLGEAGDEDLYLQPPKYVAPKTPNGTQLRRGAGGGLLRPLQKKKIKKKAISLLRFSLEEVARPRAQIIEDIVALLINGCKPSSLRLACEETCADGSGALAAEELKSCIIITKPRLRDDLRLDNLIEELVTGNGMFGAKAVVKYEPLIEALEASIQEHKPYRRSLNNHTVKTGEKRQGKKAVGLYGKEYLSPLEIAVGKSSRKRRKKAGTKTQNAKTETAPGSRDENSSDHVNSERRPVIDLAHEMYSANTEDKVRSALKLQQRGPSRGVASQKGPVIDTETASPSKKAEPVRSRLPPSGSKLKPHISNRDEPQGMSSGIAPRNNDTVLAKGRMKNLNSSMVSQKLSTSPSQKSSALPAWKLRAEQRQAAEKRRRKREKAEREKQRSGSVSSVPRVPSGTLQALQLHMLQQACLAQEKPPLVVMRVLGAMCLLLGENPTWLVAKQLVVSSCDGTSGVNFVQRLKDLDINTISEATLHRLRRVLEHAGPNFSSEYFRSLESAHLAAFAPLCEFVLTAFDMAQLLYDDKWNNVGVKDGDAIANLGDDAVRGAGQKAVKERKEANIAHKRHLKAIEKAKKEQKEADEAQQKAEEVLAQAKDARAAAKKAQESANRELEEVDAVRERIVQQRKDAEADGEIDEAEEEAHNVLVRSMLREQQEAIQAKEKADLALLEAEQLEEAAKRSLENAKIERAEAEAATKRAAKMAEIADKEEREAAEAQEETRKAIEEAKKREEARKIADLEAVENIAKQEELERESRIQIEKERSNHREYLNKIHHEREKERDQLLKKMTDEEAKEARFAAMLPTGPPPPSKLGMGKTFKSNQNEEYHPQSYNPETHVPKKSKVSDPTGNNNDDDSKREEAFTATSPVAPSLSGAKQPAISPPRAHSPSKRQQKLLERRKRSFKKADTTYVLSVGGNNRIDENDSTMALDFDQHASNLHSSILTLFDSLDANHDGFLSKLEVIRGLMKPEITKIMETTPALSTLTHPRAWAGAFHSMDTDRNGKVSLNELQTFALGMYSVVHGSGDVANATELAEHIEDITGEYRSDTSETKNSMSDTKESFHKANNLAVQTATSKIFSLLPTIALSDARKRSGKLYDQNITEEIDSTFVVKKQVLLQKLKTDAKVKSVVEECQQLRVLRSESSYAEALLLLKTSCAPEYISMRELSQFICGLIAGQIGVSRKVDAERKFQRRIREQLERLYLELGMPDGEKIVGRRFSRLQSEPFMKALEKFAGAINSDNDMKSGTEDPFISHDGYELITEFISRPNVVYQLHKMLGGQFWLAKRSVELACIGYYAIKNGYDNNIGIQKSPAQYKKQKEEVAEYGQPLSDVALIDSIETLFGECVEKEDIVSTGFFGGISSASKVDVLRTLSQPRVRERLAPCGPARCLFDTDRYWQSLQALETQSGRMATITQFEMLCFTFGMSCFDARNGSNTEETARLMTPDLSG